MRAYPAYKPSGVEWLGDVPEGWEVAPIKRNTYLKARVGWKGLTSDEFMEESFAYLVTGVDFRGPVIDWANCYQVDQARYEDDPFIHLQDGDLLITKDGTIGKLALVTGLDKPACLNSGIFVARPLHSYVTPYLYWVLLSENFAHFVDLRSYGSTINHLYQNVFEEFYFPLPPLPEQQVIAGFLDREVGKIDALVAEQRQLMALLAEKRQAVISHAVTQGLNPHAPRKPSGIDWLGDVPEGWEVVPVNYRYEVQLGRMLNEERSVGDNMRPYLRVLDVQWDAINVQDLPMMDFPPDAQARYRLEPGDLMVNEGGSYVGRSAIWRGDLDECYYQKALHRLRPRDRARDTAEFFSVRDGNGDASKHLRGGRQSDDNRSPNGGTASRISLRIPSA